MSETKFEDTEIYPAEASALGTNAYFIPGCEVVGHQPAYAACLKRVADRKHGRLASQYAECSAAIGKKECMAMKMRKEEMVEGKAIYFINRAKLRAFLQEQEEALAPKIAMYLDGQISPSRTKKRTSTPKLDIPKFATPKVEAPKLEMPKPKHFLDINTGSYVDAITAAVAAARPAPMAEIKPAEQPKPTPAAPMKAGMSLLEMARLKLAAKTHS